MPRQLFQGALSLSWEDSLSRRPSSGGRWRSSGTLATLRFIVFPFAVFFLRWAGLIFFIPTVYSWQICRFGQYRYTISTFQVPVAINEQFFVLFVRNSRTVDLSLTKLERDRGQLIIQAFKVRTVDPQNSRPLISDRFLQCSGSGFRGLLDPDPYSESGAGSRGLKKGQNCYIIMT